MSWGESSVVLSSISVMILLPSWLDAAVTFMHSSPSDPDFMFFIDLWSLKTFTVLSDVSFINSFIFPALAFTCTDLSASNVEWEAIPTMMPLAIMAVGIVSIFCRVFLFFCFFVCIGFSCSKFLVFSMLFLCATINTLNIIYIIFYFFKQHTQNHIIIIFDKKYCP